MSKKAIFPIIAVLLALSIAFIGMISSAIVRSPEIKLSFFKPAPSSTITITSKPTEETVFPVYTATFRPENTQVARQTEYTPSPTAQAQPAASLTPVPQQSTNAINQLDAICGRDDTVIVLFSIAENSNENASSPETPPISSLHYMIFNFPEQKVIDLALTSALELSGRSVQRLNLNTISAAELYAYALQNIADADLDADIVAINLTAQAIFDDFQIAPDYYVLLSFEGIAQLVDVVGGLQISIDDEHLNYPAGTHTFEGFHVVEFLSDRELAPEVQLERQQIILEAFYLKINHPASLSILPNLIERFRLVSKTNLDSETIRNLACAFENSVLDIPVFDFGSLVITHSDGLPPSDNLIEWIDKIIEQ